MSIPPSHVPASGSGGMSQHGRADVLAGLLVFLLALPLCLALAADSWFPPLAGILIAIVGGVAGLVAGRSRLSIKWAVAGIFIVAVGAVETLGRSDDGRGHHLALVAAGAASLAAGVLASFMMQLYRGMPLRKLFTVSADADFNGDGSSLRVIVHDSVVVSNYPLLKHQLETLPIGQHIIIDFSQARLVDRAALENLRHFQHEYFDTGGRVELVGLENAHPLAA